MAFLKRDNCIGYCRASQEKKSVVSFSRQSNEIEKFSRHNRMNLLSLETEVCSGLKEFEDRDIGRVLYKCRECESPTLVVFSVDRLSRNKRTMEKILKLAIRLSINIISIYPYISLFDDGKLNYGSYKLFIKGTQDGFKEIQAIKDRLNSGRTMYVENGGKLGRPFGSNKTDEQYRNDYSSVIDYLNKGYSVRETAVICCVSESTVGRLKKRFNISKSIKVVGESEDRVSVGKDETKPKHKIRRRKKFLPKLLKSLSRLWQRKK